MAVSRHPFVLSRESQIAKRGAGREARIQFAAFRLALGHRFQFALNGQRGAAVGFGHDSYLLRGWADNSAPRYIHD